MPTPPRLQEDAALAQAARTMDTPPERQKPKAEQTLTLVNFQTPPQRLIDQIAVPQDPNEEAAVADDQHPRQVKANGLNNTQKFGGDYLFFLKGNQPLALAKARQLLPGALPPSGPDAG